MYLRKIAFITISLSTALIASDFSLEANRIFESMDILELMETDIATGTPVAQKLAPAVTSIITADEITKSGARTLHEALESVPGLHIYPSSAFVMKNNISIRGIHTSINQQVLILIDGIAQNSLLTGAPELHFSMPTTLIHRIEIIRGPGSAVYGADAFSGVINIITKKYININNEFGGRYGSFNTWESWVNSKIEFGKFNIGLSVSLMKSDGDDKRVVTSDTQTNFDAIFGTSASIAPSQLNTQYDTLSIHADVNYKNFDLNFLLQDNKDLGTQEGASQALDPFGKINRTKKIINVKYTNNTLLKETIIKSSFAYTTSDSQGDYNLFPSGATLPFMPDGSLYTFTNRAFINAGAEEKKYIADISLIYSGIDNHTINGAIGYKNEELKTTDVRNFGAGVVNIGTSTNVTGTPFSFQPNNERKSHYVFFQDAFSINNRLNLTTGVRYDRYDNFGSSVNPRIALVWQQSNDLTIKTMYGRAFRAPSSGDLYFRNNPVNIGNPNIKPETIDTYEIALNHRGSIHSKLNIFYYQGKDLISSVTNPDGTSTVQNAINQNGYGFELELEYLIIDDLSVRCNYAYQHSEDAKTNDKIADAPVDQAFVQLQYKPNTKWNMNVQYHYIGKRHRTSVDTRGDMDGDSLMNLTIERKNIFKGVHLLMGARNLFDTNYLEPSDGALPNDYPMQGRYIFTEVSYNF